MNKRVTRSLVAMSLTAAIVFVIGALGVDGHSGLGRFDGDVLRYFSDNPYDIIINIAKVFDALGEQVLLLALSVAIGVALVTRRQGVAAAVVPFAATSMAVLAVAGFKDVFDRARPDVVLHLVGANSASFPSGHTTVTTSLVVAVVLVLQSSTLSRRFVTNVKTVAWVLAFFMGLSRLVLRVHWMSDVLSSWALGVALGIAAFLAGSIVESRLSTSTAPPEA